MRNRGRVAPLTAEEIDGADDVIDLGEIPFIAESAEPPRAAPPPASEGAAPSEPDGGGPAHAKRGWSRSSGPTALPRAGRARAGGKITATIRADIAAKIAMPLEIGGQIWRARDPLCGGVFLDQREAISESITDIVCDSADLVAFFTGPGGAFMKYLNLGAALWPVIEVVGAHHVYHSVEITEEPLQPQQPSQYAA